MRIVEYILDPQDKPRSYHPKTIPSFITDGGYWIHPDGSEKMIGVGLEGSIPDDVTTLTIAELHARQQAIHAEYPMHKFPADFDGEAVILTEEEVRESTQSWIDEKN